MSFRERSQSSRNGLPERRGYTWRGEANPAARAILRRLSPAPRRGRCSGCGYTTDYCCCPGGGPRGGVAC